MIALLSCLYDFRRGPLHLASASFWKHGFAKTPPMVLSLFSIERTSLSFPLLAELPACLWVNMQSAAIKRLDDSRNKMFLETFFSLLLLRGLKCKFAALLDVLVRLGDDIIGSHSDSVRFDGRLRLLSCNKYLHLIAGWGLPTLRSVVQLAKSSNNGSFTLSR